MLWCQWNVSRDSSIFLMSNCMILCYNHAVSGNRVLWVYAGFWWYHKILCHQIEESHFPQEFHYACLRNCLEEIIQWVSCVVFFTTFLYHCTLQEHMTNAEYLITMMTSSGWTLGQDISCPEDHRLLVTIVVRHWPLTICSWSVQCYRNVVINTTQLIHWIPSSRQFPRLAL